MHTFVLELCDLNRFEWIDFNFNDEYSESMKFILHNKQNRYEKYFPLIIPLLVSLNQYL